MKVNNTHMKNIKSKYIVDFFTVEITDSDDEDLVMWEKDRNYASPRYKRRSTRQRHLRFPNAGPSANTTPSGLNGHKQKKMKSQLYEESNNRLYISIFSALSYNRTVFQLRNWTNTFETWISRTVILLTERQLKLTKLLIENDRRLIRIMRGYRTIPLYLANSVKFPL